MHIFDIIVQNSIKICIDGDFMSSKNVIIIALTLGIIFLISLLIYLVATGRLEKIDNVRLLNPPKRDDDSDN